MGRDLKLDSGSAGILRKLRRRSFEKNSESLSIGKGIQKTQSLGSQPLDNIDEGLTNIVGFEMKSASVRSKASGNNGLRCYSFSLDAGEISDHIALRIQSQSPTPSKILINVYMIFFMVSYLHKLDHLLFGSNFSYLQMMNRICKKETRSLSFTK